MAPTLASIHLETSSRMENLNTPEEEAQQKGVLLLTEKDYTSTKMEKGGVSVEIDWRHTMTKPKGLYLALCPSQETEQEEVEAQGRIVFFATPLTGDYVTGTED